MSSKDFARVGATIDLCINTEKKYSIQIVIGNYVEAVSINLK